MKTPAILVTCLCVILIGGCATYDAARLDDLDSRLARLETKGTPTPEATAEDTSAEGTARDIASAAGGKTLAPEVIIPETPTKKDIQISLKNAGYYDGKVDGKLGPKTKAAIEAFQDANNLVADGKAGVNTWSKLRAFYTPPSEE